MYSKISNIRREYKLKSLLEDETPQDPITLFLMWWNEALVSNIDDVNAMTLSTVDSENNPNARIVLLKNFDNQGFQFFTNYESDKALELLYNSHCSLLFFWKELERQVRIKGCVKKIEKQANDLYFSTRPDESKISAIISPQSKKIANRNWLEKAVIHFKNNNIERSLPCPNFWGGYIVNPHYFEFWQGRENRLHDRICYKKKEDLLWEKYRIAP